MFSGAGKFLFERASKLRKQQTFAEEILWAYLKTKPLGFKFRRQHPYSAYILDFYCHQLKLAIEVDGLIHNLDEVKQNDAIRQKQLEEEGLTFLRLFDEQIKLKPEEVFHQIEILLNGKTEASKASPT
jgi:very-short-patch-repair endonuclease